MPFLSSTRQANIQYLGDASIAAAGNSGSYRLPYSSFSTYTFFVYPGTSTVALQASPDGSNWITLPSAGAITANTVYPFSNPLPFVRYTVTGGTVADCYVVWSDNL